MTLSADIHPIERKFLPKDFAVTTWEAIEMYFKTLLDRTINNKQDLEQWLKDSSELEAIVSEEACWRQVRMTCDTENKELEDAFNCFYMEIAPKMQPYADKLNRKLVECLFTKELD